MKIHGPYPDPIQQAYEAYLWNRVVLRMDFECNVEYVFREYAVDEDEFLEFVLDMRELEA